ncbi:MAG: cyclic nucleotide-binding domain-containing protein [Blastocatellia bacterium]|nr:cyclic nucleotide-binding domain-containing protein [Blastocatellia bacterium]
MAQERKSRREVLAAIKSIPSISELLSAHEGHYDHELDLEVTVYGRNYGGKKVGPYVRLLNYEPGEAVIMEGDWGGNTFYIVADGYVDVFIKTPDNREAKVAELKAGTQFGEMSVLAGVPRNATVKAPSAQPAQILEIQRPALRLLRKLPKFSESLDKTYRSHGRNASIEDLKVITGVNPALLDDLKNLSLFRVFSKNHVLFREKAKTDRLYIIKEGWFRRSQETDRGEEVEDFLGRGYCLGVEGMTQTGEWPYTVTLMGRTEVLEISVMRLRQNPELLNALTGALGRFSPPPFMGKVSELQPAVRDRMLTAQEDLIDTGLVDGNNLLVMDMDLCVRCGNCSLACHKIHGQSRLLRRGVHVTRLDAPRPSAIQSVLSPSVCMHCKDPECLTGCPTGAIGRFGQGQVDIEPRTCIGCGDCATQCPYNAITLIPRRPKAAEANGGFAGKLRDLFRLAPDPLPPPVETTEDLVAVKCNLCNDRTTLNPPGSKRQAYSCEENCPTGALARVNPRQYFAEIGAIEGLMLMDQTHAVGRNIHKSDPPKRLTHIIGILLTVILTAATVWGINEYGLGERLLSFLNMRWITGLVGLIGIAAVMAYPVRRQMYRRRAGPLRYWMLAHSYLGVIAGIMILLHGGTSSGGALTTALMISWDLVILTGLFGIFIYFVGPRILTKIEGSPLLIDDLKARREELQKDIATIASSPSEPLRNLVRNRVIPRFVTFGYLLRQYLKRENLDDMIHSAKESFKADSATLSDEKDRRKLDRAVEAAVTLRRVDALIYVHRILKLWLAPHVAFTSLMLALMIVHIIQVIYYAAR